MAEWKIHYANVNNAGRENGCPVSPPPPTYTPFWVGEKSEPQKKNGANLTTDRKGLHFYSISSFVFKVSWRMQMENGRGQISWFLT